MLALTQMIDQMIYLEYTEDEVRDILSLLEEGEITFDSVYESLNMTFPPEAIIERFKMLLKNSTKINAAVHIAFLKAEGAWSLGG